MARLSLQPLLVVGALSFPACACAAQQPAVSPQVARRALEEFADRAQAHGASGILLVADRDSILVHRAMGWRDPARRIPNDTSTLFYIASLAKQFVAAAVLRLEEDGRLRTSDSLPAFLADVPPDKRRITIDQLLAHTAALGRYGFDPVRRDWAVQNRNQAVAGILRTPLTGEPGVRFDYQNANYLLLAAIIEHVTRLSLEDYIAQSLLRPVGARDTYIGRYVTPELRNRVAWSIGDEAESFTIIDRTPTWLSHGRGVVTTAADLYRWLRGIERGVVLSDAARRKL